MVNRIQLLLTTILTIAVVILILQQRQMSSRLPRLLQMHTDLEGIFFPLETHPFFMATGFDQHIGDGIGIEFEHVVRQGDTTFARGRLINHNATSAMFLQVALLADTASACLSVAGTPEFSSCSSLVSRVEIHSIPLHSARSFPFRIAVHTPGDSANYRWSALLLSNSSMYLQ